MVVSASTNLACLLKKRMPRYAVSSRSGPSKHTAVELVVDKSDVHAESQTPNNDSKESQRKAAPGYISRTKPQATYSTASLFVLLT
jgi:hypothetical protein